MRSSTPGGTGLPERNRFMKGLYAWVGLNGMPEAYTPQQRSDDTIRFSPLRLIRLSLGGLTAFTTRPLRAVSAAGFLLALPSFLYGAYLTVEHLMGGHPVSGWTTIVVSLMLCAGRSI